MSDKPRCPSCGHPLDQKRIEPVYQDPEGGIAYDYPEWSPCDEGCRHGGHLRIGAHVFMDGSTDWREVTSPAGHPRGEARVESTNRWPVEVKCARCEGVLGDGCCTRCLGTGRVTLCHTCAKEGR